MFNLTGLTVDYLWGRALNGEDSLDDKKRGNEGLPVLPCFDVVNSEKATAELFAKAMQEFSSTHDYKIDTLVQQFNWQRLGSASIVDVRCTLYAPAVVLTTVQIGGSSGFVTVALARAFPRLKIEVQDLPNVIQESTSHPLDPVLGNRVKFVAHDFFQPQTRVDVDVFFIRHVLHNWADLEAVAIIRNLFPALARGKRVLVVDSILHNEEESAPSSLLRSER